MERRARTKTDSLMVGFLNEVYMNKMEPEIYRFKATVSQYYDGRLQDSIECEMYFTNIFQIHDTLVSTHTFLRSKGATELVKIKRGKYVPMRLRRAPPIDFIASLSPKFELHVTNLSYFEEDVETVVEYSVRRILTPVTPIKSELLRFKPRTTTKTSFHTPTIV